jgi:hypothetical protein
MSLYRTFFPLQHRGFRGMRWLNISLRTLHLIGIAGIGGAYFYPADEAAWLPFLWLTVIAGSGLVAVSIYSNGVWLLQLRGMLIGVKLLLLMLLAFWPQAAAPVAIAVVAISSFIAHAPGKVRYYSPWHRRSIEHL